MGKEWIECEFKENSGGRRSVLLILKKKVYLKEIKQTLKG